jgi:hypothetical protein
VWNHHCGGCFLLAGKIGKLGEGNWPDLYS